MSEYASDQHNELNRKSPHWRSPHWRIQHYGPENKQTKLIFIAPVFVGALKTNEVLNGRKISI